MTKIGAKVQITRKNHECYGCIGTVSAKVREYGRTYLIIRLRHALQFSAAVIQSGVKEVK